MFDKSNTTDVEYIEGQSIYEKPFIGGLLAKLSFGPKERSIFYTQLARFMENGVSESSAVKEASLEYAKYSSLKLYQFLYSRISYFAEFKKIRLAEAIKDFIPQEEYFILKATDGVDSKVKISAYNAASEMCLKKAELSSAVKASSSKMIALLLAFFGLVYLISIDLIPNLQASIEEKFWNESFVNLVAFSTFIISYWWVVVAFFIGLSVGVSYMLPRNQGEARSYLDKVFPFSVYKNFTSAGFIQSIASMKAAGTSFSKAIKTLYENANGYTASFVERMMNTKATGASDGESLKDSNFFDDKTSADLAIYSKSQSLDSALPSVADSSLEDAIKNVKAVLGRISFFILAGIVSFMIWMLYAVMFTVMNIG